MKRPSPKPETQQADSKPASRHNLSAKSAASEAFVSAPKAIGQHQVDQSPRMRRQVQLQAKIDDSPQQVAQHKQVKRLFGPGAARPER